MSKRKMTYICVMIIVSLVLSILILWLYPVKKVVRNFQIDNIQSENYDVLLCTGTQTTGSFWQVMDSTCKEDIPELIDLVGNVPECTIKSNLYKYMDNNFCFIGKYDNNDNVFIVQYWGIVENVKRRDMLLPYPSYGLNIFELDFNKIKSKWG